MALSLEEALENHDPFLVNKYTKWYLSLVSSDSDDAYTEKHHILPRSLFPEYKNCKWNIVKLSARKHFMAHMLLCKMLAKNNNNYGKMLSAAMRMKCCNKSQQIKRKFYVNSRIFEIMRIEYSQYLTGKTMQEKTKKLISEKLTGIVRGAMSEEAKLKMIATKKLRHVNKIWMHKDSEQTKVVLEKVDDYLNDGWSKGVSRKHITEEFKNKLSTKTSDQWKKLKSTGHKSNLKRIESCL
jgi:hypothetical protein